MGTRDGSIFLTGRTGYIGSRLIPALQVCGHVVRAPVRQGSEAKLPSDDVPQMRQFVDASLWVARVCALVAMVAPSRSAFSQDPVRKTRRRSMPTV